jgi:ribosomal protein S18 acetylase RimI-like enzyme
MQADEVGFAIELATAEGWNPGLHDAQAFYETDPNGFFIGLLDGNPVGCISAVSYEGKFAFIGLYIVAPQHRSKGYGIQLWQHAVRRLQGHNIGLDGVIERQPQYRKSGFSLAYRNIRFEGKAKPSADRDPALTDIGKISFEQLTRYDAPFFPAQRDAFLRAWLRMPNAHGLAYLKNGEILGYGVIRECRSGYKIGPLFANHPDIAESLLTGLSSSANVNAPVYLDVPELNANALALADRYGMRKVFETARFYTNEAQSIEL